MTRRGTLSADNPQAALLRARKLNDGIRWELRQHPPAKVAAFVKTVGVSLGAAEIFLASCDEAKRRADLERLKRATEEYRDVLCQPVSAREFPRSIVGKPDADRGEPFYRARETAWRAADELLVEIGTALRLAKPRARGRPKADEVGLLTRIAARYLELFGERPTGTPGGTFANIATLVLENLYGKAPRDVSRQVRAAIKML